MKHFAILACAVGVVLSASSVMGRSIPGAPNEVLDPWFQQTADPTVWWISGTTWSTAANPGNLSGGYFDPGRTPGSVATLRTIVDDATSPLWDPALEQKHIDYSMFAHLNGDGYVKVRFDWWLDDLMPRPSPDPNLAPPADGVTDWYIATAANAPGDFQNRPDLILPGESPGFFLPDGIESFLLDVDEVWDIQPRWVSIEIEVGIDPQSSIGGEALITGIDFEAECIPLPSAAPMGLAMLGGIGLVRRRRVRG